MPFPTDRGYVAVTDLDDGGKRVEIYARKSGSGPSHLFATYGKCREVVVETETPFEAWGSTTVSSEIVEVNYDLAKGRLYVREPVESPGLD